MSSFVFSQLATPFAPWQATVDFNQPLGVANIRGFGAVESFACTDGTFLLLHLQGAVITDIVHSQSSSIAQTASWIESTLTPAGTSLGRPGLWLADLTAYLATPGASNAGAAALLMQGDDSFVGTAGNETFLGGGGSNTVDYSGAGAAIRASLATGVATGQGTDTLTQIQNLIGSGFADRLTGDAGANRLLGGAGNDSLYGGAGADTLGGGVGNDLLTGGAGADAFRFAGPAEGADRVADFQHGVDALEFSAAGFGGGLVAGQDMALAHGFIDGGRATEAHGQFLYNHSNGVLFWDADGTGAGAKVMIATLAGAPQLTAADLHVIA